MRMALKVGIGLFGKGAINHLHREEFVRALKENNFRVTFFIDREFIEIINKIGNCEYISCHIPKNSQYKQKIVDTCRMIRWLYPSRDVSKRMRLFKGVMTTVSLIGRVFLSLFFIFAFFRSLMKLIMKIENMFIVEAKIDSQIDVVVLSGVGCRPPDGVQELSRWAKKNGKPIIYVASNYDSLSTRGYRGVEVKHLLVWGQHMVKDGISLHGIKKENIKIVGPLRYDCIESIKKSDIDDTFLTSRNMDPKKKTIFFAGATYPFHYVEMLSIFKGLKDERDDIQLVLRIYPNKYFRQSPYLAVIDQYAKNLGCYVSYGDVFKKDIYPKNQDVLWIEEYELFNFIKISDVVINIFSTLAIESLIFDKPTIYMNYKENFFQRDILKKATYLPFEIRPPIKRLIEYDAIDIAYNRKDMIRLIIENIDQKRDRPQRKTLVSYECGILDGNASGRVASYCRSVINHRNE